MSTSTERWQAHINKLERGELTRVSTLEEGCTLTSHDVSKFYAVFNFQYPHRHFDTLPQEEKQGFLILACGFFMEYETDPD